MVLSVLLQVQVTANVTLLPDYDEAIYWDVSRNCHETGYFYRSMGDRYLFFDHPPLFLYLASPVFYLTDEMAGFRFVVSLFSCLLIALTALLASRLFGRGAALPAAIVLAFNPLFLFYANKAYQDVPFCVPVLLAFLAAFAGQPVRSGLWTGAAFLIKYFAAGFAGFLWLYTLLTGPSGRRASLKFAVVFVLLASLWPVAGLLLDQKGFLGKLDYWNEMIRPDTLAAVKSHPVASFGEYLQSIFDRLTTLHVLLLGAGFLGQLFRLKRSKLEVRIVLFTVVGYVAVLMSAFALRTDRYILETLPFLAVLTGGTLARMGPSRWLVLGLVSLLSPWVVMPGMTRMPPLVTPYYGEPVYEYARSVEDAAAFISEQMQPGELMMVNWNGPRFGYFARRPYRFLYISTNLASALSEIDKSDAVVRDHESGGWHLPYLTEDEIRQVEAHLDRSFDSRAFGPVRVYVRRRTGEEKS